MGQFDYIYKLLLANEESQVSMWDGRRTVIINFIILISVPIYILFTFLNFQHAFFSYAYINILITVLLISTFFYFRITNNIGHASSAMLIALLTTHIMALFQGGIANSAFYWFFFFPPLAILFKGHKSGLYWVIVLLLSILTMFIYQMFYVIELPYQPALLPILMICLILETVMALFIESTRVDYDNNLQEMNKTLQSFNTDLEKKVALELEKSILKDQLINQQAKMAEVGEMTNYIAHQWKQPLSLISTIVQTMELQKELDTFKEEDLLHELHKIDHQVSHMKQTMVDFNNFTKPDQPKEVFNINKAIQETADMVEPLLRTKGILLTLNTQNIFLKCFGQRNLLIHVFLNLINNAKDALLSQEEKKPEITVSVNEDCSEITVKDNGAGVNPSIENQIFDAHFSTKGSAGGGIGLNMCKRIIEENFHGSLELRNTLHGASFVIHLNPSLDEDKSIL